jgi:hypothetical protein
VNPYFKNPLLSLYLVTTGTHSLSWPDDLPTFKKTDGPSIKTVFSHCPKNIFYFFIKPSSGTSIKIQGETRTCYNMRQVLDNERYYLNIQL